MIDKHQEADLLRSLAEAYKEVINETAKGKMGRGTGDAMPGGAAAGAGGGGGKAGVWTPARGAGADKKIKNDPKADDERAERQKKQALLDRNDHRSVTPRQRKERARANKENKAKAGIDSILKDIRGK